MKEILPKIFKLETESEREEFFNSLFVTDLFKEMIKNKHPVIEMIKRSYVKFPRYFYHMQDKELERAAFTSWYNVLSLKEYQNKHIQDLYFFHELTHISTMNYDHLLDFKSWSVKMRNNEVLASMNSEVLIYFYSPEYRKFTFNEEIWADRFLNKKYYQELSENDQSRLNIDLTSKRLTAYDNPQDKVEMILADFREFSHLFYKVWEDKHNELELVLEEFYKGDTVRFESFLKEHQSNSGILFEDKVKKHQDNYIQRNKNRPHY